jgi:hypothetical protein
VRNNHFQDIYCRTGKLAEHAIHFWTGARDTLVENNTIVNCARGVGFGLVDSGDGRVYPDDPYPNMGYIGHYDGIIRNNVIYADVATFDTGIELDQARGARVYHNTVFAAPRRHRRVQLDRRALRQHPGGDPQQPRRPPHHPRWRHGDRGSQQEMVTAAAFKNVGALDFHLAPAASDAIDKGVAVTEAGLDMDGEALRRGHRPGSGRGRGPLSYMQSPTLQLTAGLPPMG